MPRGGCDLERLRAAVSSMSIILSGIIKLQESSNVAGH